MKLYLKFVAMNLKSQMQYKISFILMIIGRLFIITCEILMIFFLFDRYNSVQGFTVEDILICASAIIMAFSIAECFARGLDTFSSVVRNGEFDRIMVRPRNEMFLIISGKMDFTRLGFLISGVTVLFYAVYTGNVDWTADKIFTFAMMIIAGIIIFSSLFLIYAGFCFFTLEGLEFMNIFIYGGRTFGQYPFVIYGNYLLRFFTFVIPLALFQYYPLLYVLGKTDNQFYMFTPFLAMLFVIPAYGFWRFGVKRYKSNGS